VTGSFPAWSATPLVTLLIALWYEILSMPTSLDQRTDPPNLFLRKGTIRLPLSKGNFECRHANGCAPEQPNQGKACTHKSAPIAAHIPHQSAVKILAEMFGINGKILG
jgi:hypothetical protein